MISVRTRVLAFAALCLASVCSAQTPEEVRRDGRVHVGPFYVTPRFSVKDFGVDTNVFNAGQAARDFTFTVAPEAKVSVPFGRRAVVTTTLGTDLVYYRRYASERSVDPEVMVRAEGFLGHVVPYVETAALRTRQRPNHEIDARLLRRERRVTGGVKVVVSPKLSFDLSSLRRAIEYDEDAAVNDIRLQETLNRTIRVQSFEGRYEATPLTTLSVRVDAAQDRFEFSPMRDADSTAIVPGVEFAPRALISGVARLGVKRFNPIHAALEPFSGVVAEAALSYTLQGATKFTFKADRDLTYSYERAQPYFVVDGYGVEVRRHLTGPIDVRGAFDRQRYSYRDLLLPGAAPLDLGRVDRTRTWSGAIGYRLGRSVHAGVGAAWRERASTSLRFRHYQGLRFTSTLDYEF